MAMVNNLYFFFRFNIILNFKNFHNVKIIDFISILKYKINIIFIFSIIKGKVVRILGKILII